jgi:hypothetical protein
MEVIMTNREILHVIVDRLPDEELTTAARILIALDQPSDAFQRFLANAPIDDEPFDPSDLEDDESEPSIAHHEVVGRYRE